MAKKTKPKPCPCCGNQNLYTGHLEATQLGVWCFGMVEGKLIGCGLQIHRSVPETWPKGVQTLKQLDAYLLEKAVAAWNKRV